MSFSFLAIANNPSIILSYYKQITSSYAYVQKNSNVSCCKSIKTIIRSTKLVIQSRNFKYAIGSLSDGSSATKAIFYIPTGKEKSTTCTSIKKNSDMKI